MPGTRELILLIRAEDRASGSLRRIGRDMQGLSRMAALQHRQQQLAINAATKQQQLQRAARDIESRTSGTKFIELQKQRGALEKARTLNMQKHNKVLREQEKLANNISKAQTRQYVTLPRRLEDARIQQARLEARQRDMKAPPTGAISQAELYPQTGAARKSIIARQLASNLQLQKQITAEQITQARATQNLVNSSAGLGAAYGNTKARAAELNVTERQLAQAHALNNTRIAELRSQLATTGQRLSLVRQQQAGLNKEIRRARWEPLARGGAIMQHVSRLFQYGGIIIGAGIGLAANAAAKFSTSVTLAATQTRKAGQSFVHTAANSKFLQKSILELMKQFPASADEMSQAAYDIYSSTNVSLTGGVRLLKIFNKAAVAGQTSLDEVARAGITVMNNFRLGPAQMTKAMQTMFASVRYGRMTFSQFVQTMNQISPAFAAAGASFLQMNQAMAFASRVMPNTRMASTALARLTETFGKKNFIEGAKTFGITMTDVHKRLLPLPVIIDKLVQKFPDLQRAVKTGKGDTFLQNLIKTITAAAGGKGETSTIQARRMLTFMITQLPLLKKIYKDVAKDQNEFTQSFLAMSKTPGVQWGTFINLVKALAITIGTQAIPALIELGKPVARAVEWFNKLDDSTKKLIGRWSVFGAVGLMVAGTLSLILGSVIRIVALLAGRGLLFGGFVAAIVAVSLVAGLLAGHLHSVSDAVDAIVGRIHGFTGWGVALGVAAVGAYKLANALRGVALASAATSVAGGAGGAVGIFGRTGAGARGLKELYQVRRLEGAGRSMAMLAASAAMVPGPLWVAGAAIGAAIVGVKAWQHHMAGVAKQAERVDAALARNKAFGARPAKEIKTFGGLSGDVLEYRQASLNLKNINEQIKQVRKQLSTAPASERQGLLNQLEQFSIDKARAINAVGIAAANANRSFAAQTNAVRYLSSSYLKLVENQSAAKNIQAELARLGTGNRYTRDTIAQLRTELSIRLQNVAGFKAQIAAQQAQLRLAVRANLRGFATQGLIPKASPRFSNEIAAIAVKMQRMLTRKEITMYVRARLKGDAAGLTGQLKAFFKMIDAQLMRKAGRESVVTIKPKVKLAAVTGFGKNPFQAGGIFSALGKLKAASVIIKSKVAKPGNQNAVQKNVIAFFASKPAKMRLTVIKPPDLAGIGADITRGIQAGMTSVNQTVTVQKVINELVTTFHHEGRGGSPYMLFADEVGVPIIDGILLGILKDHNKIEKTAQLVISLFAGAFLQARESKLTDTDPLKVKKYEQQAKDALARFKKTHKQIDKIRAAEYEKKADKARGGAPLNIKDLIKDTQGQAKAFTQFNNAIAKLTSRKLPKELLDQLAALGVDGLKYIMLLANATPKELAKFVRAWKNMTGQVKRSQRETVENTKQMHDDMVAELKQMGDDAAQKLLDMYNNFKSINTQNFGALFEGPTNLSSMTGSNYDDAMASFNDAMASYNSQIADYQLQLDDLRGQVNSLTADTIKQKVDELQGVFGELFHGPWLSDKLDWGKALKMKDLQRDLDEQLKRFRDWRGALNSLLSRGVSRDMLKQLEALGPDATDMLNVLNNATDEELTKYVGTWNAAQGELKQVATDSLAFDQDYQRAMGAILYQIAQVVSAMEKLQAPIAPHALTGADILADLQAQIDGWEEFQGVLQGLIDKGLPDELIMQLSQMGPQALVYLRALNTMTPEQLKIFVAKWEESQELITAATTKQMEIQLKMWRKHGQDIANQIIAGVMDEQYILLEFFKRLFMSLLAGKLPDLTDMPTGAPPGTGGSDTSPGDDGRGADNSGADPTGGGQRGGIQQFPSTFNSTSTSGTTVNQTVIAHEDESLDTTLTRAKFRYETRLPE